MSEALNSYGENDRLSYLPFVKDGSLIAGIILLSRSGAEVIGASYNAHLAVTNHIERQKQNMTYDLYYMNRSLLMLIRSWAGETANKTCALFIKTNFAGFLINQLAS